MKINNWKSNKIINYCIIDKKKKLIELIFTPKKTLQVKVEQMWSYYIDAMRDLNQDMSTEPTLKRKSLGEAYKAGYESGFLSEKHFSEYIEILMKAKKIKNEYLLEVGTNKITNLLKIN